jgi:hypothetical protein
LNNEERKLEERHKKEINFKLRISRKQNLSSLSLSLYIFRHFLEKISQGKTILSFSFSFAALHCDSTSFSHSLFSFQPWFFLISSNFFLIFSLSLIHSTPFLLAFPSDACVFSRILHQINCNFLTVLILVLC